MILVLTKNSLIEAQLKDNFDNIKFYREPIKLIKELNNFDNIALIIENTGFEISGFLFSAIIDKLIPDRQFYIYLLTNDNTKSFIINKTFQNIITVTYAEISKLSNILILEKNKPIKIEDEDFFNALDNIFNTERLKTFILDYSHLILENIIEPNVWFNEYYELVSLITGTHKILIKVSNNELNIIFSSVDNFNSYQVIQKELTCDIKKYTTILPNNFFQIDEKDIFTKYNIFSFGENIGTIILFYNKLSYNKESIEPIINFLLNPLKTFIWHNSYCFLKEKISYKNNISNLFKNVYINLMESAPKLTNIDISANKSSFFTLEKNENFYYFFSTATNELSSIFYIYLNNILSDEKIEFEDLLLNINSFIRKNILYLHPLPLGLLKISNGKGLFSATEGMICLFKSESIKKVFETNMQYFGTYDIINPVIKEFSFTSDTYLHLIPDAFFSTMKERSILINEFLKG